MSVVSVGDTDVTIHPNAKRRRMGYYEAHCGRRRLAGRLQSDDTSEILATVPNSKPRSPGFGRRFAAMLRYEAVGHASDVDSLSVANSVLLRRRRDARAVDRRASEGLSSGVWR